MTNDRIILFAILTAIAVGAIVAFKLRQNAIARRYLEKVNRENHETQQFILARLDAIGQLVQDTEISISDLQQKADSLFAEMESRNARGDLTPLIEDTKGYVDAEIKKRR